MSDSTYYVQGSTMQGIADAIRGMRHEKGALTPAQMQAKIESSVLGIPISIHINSETGRWERPLEYPNLDAIDLPEDFDGVYMTYDLRKTPSYAWIGVWATTSGG